MKPRGGWPIRPFAEVADYGVGKTPARANAAYWAESEGNIPWVSISDLEPFGVVTTTKERASSLAFTEVFRGKLVPAGTLLMSFKLTIGRVATLGLPATHNEAIISIYPRAGMNQRFLGYFLSQFDYGDLQDRQIKGNTLNKSKIDRIPVPVPPESEQAGIADVLDVLRHAIYVQGALLRSLDQMKAAAMQRLFSRGLRGEAQKETEIGPIPESWDLRTIPELCDIWSGGTPRKANPDYWDGDVPWVSGKDLKKPALDDATDHVSQIGIDNGSRLAPSDSVLILVRGMGLAKDLPVAVINRPMAFNQDVKALVSKLGYSGSFLRSAIYGGKERLLSQLATSAHGTKTLNLDDLAHFVVPTPPTLREADEIAHVLDTLDRKIELHRRKREILGQLFESLLHKLMTGEVAVDDLDLSVLPKHDGRGA